MTKVGRNHPCPCGSGKKYKQCCLDADEAARIAAPPKPTLKAALKAHLGTWVESDRLDQLSNGSLDLINAGQLDEAERVCEQLLAEFPDVFDGHMRLGCGSMTKPVVDVEDDSTWPAPVSAWVAEWAARLANTTEYASDLNAPYEEDENFLRLFDGYLLRAYHATRLLPHERQMIVNQGLRISSASLITDRIAAAVAAGEITAAEQAALVNNHAYSPGADRFGASGRADRVCLIFTRRMLDDDPGAVEDLLTNWGGEVIYSYPHPTQQRLRSLGCPSIVVAGLDVAANPNRDSFFPRLCKVFLGERLGLQCRGGEIHHKAPIAPDCIEAIWSPGDPSYDRYKRLPR